jgi:hypothetical protein
MKPLVRMRRHGAVLIIVAGLFAAGGVAPADAQSRVGPGHGHANGHDKGHCRAFHAHGVGVDDGLGTTKATIYRGQREVATSVGTFTVTGVDADGLATFAGGIVLTNDHGTLNAPVTGTLDTTTGEFVSLSDTVTGTGDYATVTGWLRFAGTEDLTALTFTETVHGKLCVPTKKQH